MIQELEMVVAGLLSHGYNLDYVMHSAGEAGNRVLSVAKKAKDALLVAPAAGALLLAGAVTTVAVVTIDTILSIPSAYAQEAESVEKHGVKLFKADGHYATVWSQQGAEHAQEMAAKVDELYDNWLFRYAGVFQEPQKNEGESRQGYALREAAYKDLVKTFKIFPILNNDVAREVAFTIKRRQSLEAKIEKQRAKVEGASGEDTKARYQEKLDEMQEDLAAMHALKRPTRKLTVEMYIGLEKTKEALGGKPLGGYAESTGITTVAIRYGFFTVEALAHELTHQFLRFYVNGQFHNSVLSAVDYHWAVEAFCDYHGMEATDFSNALSKTKSLIQANQMHPLSKIIERTGSMYKRSDPNSFYTASSVLIFLAEKYEPSFYKFVSFVAGGTVKSEQDLTTVDKFLKYTGINKTPEAFEKEFHDFVLSR